MWFNYVCTCMFRRPLRAENPWWDIEDASIWSSSTRWDSMPRGGHSEGRQTLYHSFLKALKSYDKSTDSFIWADVFQTLTISHFLQRKTICAEQRLKLEPTAVLVQKARNSSWKPKSLWGKNMSALTFTAFSSEFAHWTHRKPLLLLQIPPSIRDCVFCSGYNVICGCFPEILTLWLSMRRRLLSLLFLLLFPHLP